MLEKISKPLYGGDVVLDFYPEKHWYKMDSKFVPSVTGICGIVDKSAPLMYWAVNCFRDFLYGHLDSGSTIDRNLVDIGTKERRNVSKTALDVGTLVHDYCEQYAKGITPEMPENAQAQNGIKAFLDRVNTNDVKFIENERLIYSKTFGYCGKFDTIVEVKGNRYMADFKTSKDFYPMEMGMQLAAYRNAYEEETNEKLDGQFIIRLGKDTGEFEIHWCKEYEKDLESFLAAIILHKRKKETDKQKEKMI